MRLAPDGVGWVDGEGGANAGTFPLKYLLQCAQTSKYPRRSCLGVGRFRSALEDSQDQGSHVSWNCGKEVLCGPVDSPALKRARNLSAAYAHEHWVRVCEVLGEVRHV